MQGVDRRRRKAASSQTTVRTARVPRSPVAAVRWGWRKIPGGLRPAVAVFLFFSILGLVAAACHVVPAQPPGEEPYTTTQIALDLVQIGYQRAVPIVERLSWRVPAFVPLWSIPKPQGRLDARFPTAEELEEDMHKMLPSLDLLRHRKFFRIFKVDLQKSCPFWARKEMCASPGACTVCECDDHDVPLPWKEKPMQNYVNRAIGEKVSIWQTAKRDSPDFGLLQALAGEDAGGKPSYVDLVANPPGFTSYKGRNIWSLIYKENCLKEKGHLLRNDGMCSEEEAFYKLMSGMQTAVMVMSSEYNRPGLISYDLSLFKRGVAANKEWINNLYFSFAALSQTMCRARNILMDLRAETDNPQEDDAARSAIRELYSLDLSACQHAEDAKPLFDQRQDEAIRKLQNITDIIDCLECEKCRLHGLMKVTAIGCTLKALGTNLVHFGYMERNEIIALINSVHYFATCINIIRKFERRVFFLRLCWTLGCLATSLIVGRGIVVVRYFWRFIARIVSRRRTAMRLRRWKHHTE